MRKFYNFTVKFLFEISSVVVSVLICITLVFVFFFRIIGISGDSMLPTLNHGDKYIVTVNQTDYNYKDIVIIVQPGVLNEPLVKRVIATGGQWVNVDYEQGIVYVGDSSDSMIPLNEDYILEPATEHNFDDIYEYPVYVPEGMLFVMGDNRNNSTDSRSYLVGFIDEDYVLGKTSCRIWSENVGFEFLSVNK